MVISKTTASFIICLTGLAIGLAADVGKLEWKQADGYRIAALPVTAKGQPGFTLLAPNETNVRFTNSLSESRALLNQNLLNGSGVALGDYDGDGWCDIYLCDLGGTNVLYRNLGGWKFQDVTREAGVSCPNQISTGAVFADVNGDGWLDLLVTSMGGPNALFLNDGRGHFRNVTVEAGLVSRLGSTTMALADVNGDGALDLYVANYGVTSILRTGGALNVTTVDGKPVVRGRYAQRIKFIDGMMYELGEPDVLYLNDGHGKFTPMSWTDGTFLDEDGKPLAAAPWDQSLTVLFRDINGDGWPDIYVCSDASTPDRCWINDGHGRFRALSTLAIRQTSYFSMGADFADIDRDGFDDFLVLDMQSRQHELMLTQKGDMFPQRRIPGDLRTQFQIRRNTLFHARGDATFAEIANFSGVASSEWSWSCIFLDIDLDGWEDILITNGFPYNADDLDTKERVKRMGTLSVEQSRKTVLLYPPLNTPDVAFRNQHDLTFREIGKEWGFDSKQVANGMALADLDNDGDLDVVVNCLNGPALLYRNDTTAPRLAVRLRGNAPNTQGIGARLKILGGPVTQTQEVICGGRYMSGDDPTRVFAAGSLTNQPSIEVTWRSGKKSVISQAKPDCIYEIDEAKAVAAQSSQSKVQGSEPAPLFEDVSTLIGHTHHEEPYDDLARQPLLPKLLSQMGPGVAWFDWNGDGHDDLIVGTGRAGSLAVFLHDGKGHFSRVTSQVLNTPAPDDFGGIVGFVSAPGKRSILAALGNYESGSTNSPSVLRYDWSNDGVTAGETLPPFVSCSGPLALSDIDGDGQLDLFVGGRVLAGRYPKAPSSRIYRGKAGRFQLDEENSQVLGQVGLVNGAVWSDLDGDGLAELILACEWGPVKIYRNDKGKLTPWDPAITFPFSSRHSTLDTLNKLTGWWNGVTAGDFDGDGRMDIVASNWGRNTRYEAHRVRPLRVYSGDLAANGTEAVVEAYFDVAMGKAVPERSLEAMVIGVPSVRDRFKTHKAYAEASVEEIFGDRLRSAKLSEAAWLETTVFLNRGDHFDVRPLPLEAQFAPAFGVCVGDMDGDGNEDVFLAQNFFAIQPEPGRYDAGRGLWLRGDGKGNFIPMSGQESGVKVYGEQRGSALCDYDEDGRVDFLVTQNGTVTKLYRNVGGKPGLRVRLVGPEGNPNAVGAALRLVSGQKTGPVREIHAGSGYWSQDSAVQVMAIPESLTQIWVRWPGGKTVTANVPSTVREISVDSAGTVELRK